MLNKAEIEDKLKYLDSQFRKAKGVRSSRFYSKMALLELSGWIEVSLDKIIEQSVKRKLKLQINKDYLSKDVIKPIYGFQYDKHLKIMIIKSVGLIGFEKITESIDPTIWTPFESSLNALFIKRNQQAHTEIKRTTLIDAPSVTINEFYVIHKGLLALETGLRAYINTAA